MCRWQQFNASCADDEVIMMTSAQYGRMKLGNCMSRDYFIGCAADVLQQADERCSGKRKCNIPVPVPEWHELQPCPKDLGTYMEASYDCVKGRSLQLEPYLLSSLH